MMPVLLAFPGMPAVYAACGIAAGVGALVTYALTPKNVAGQNGGTPRSMESHWSAQN